MVLWALLAVVVKAQDASPQDPPTPSDEEVRRRLGNMIEGFGHAHQRRASQEQYNAVVAEIAQQVAKLRGLKLKSTITPRLMTPHEVQGFFDANTQFNAERVRGQELALKALHLAPDEKDLTFIAQMSGIPPVAGFYDPDSKLLVVLRTTDPDSLYGRAVLAHEITHALQDQHYNLRKYAPEVGQTSLLHEDNFMARKAIVEGDAEHAESQWREAYGETVNYLSQPSLLADSGSTAGQYLPPEFRALSGSGVPAFGINGMFPYRVGMQFLSWMEGTKAQNPYWRETAFRASPVSTEQILHPGKKYYPRSEAPRKVALPAWEEGRDGLKEMFRQTLGEWTTRLALLPEEDIYVATSSSDSTHPAILGAAGWGGDQMVVLAGEDTGRWVAAWGSEWDTAGDAAEFISAYRTRLAAVPALQGTTHPAVTEGEWAEWSAEGRTVRLLHEGDRVLTLIGPEADLVRAVQAFYAPEESAAPENEANESPSSE